MKKITLLILCLMSYFTYSQVNIDENFDAGTPGDWTGTYANSNELPCSGGSERDNIFNADNGNLTSPNLVAGSNGTDLNISFDYKIVDYDSGTFGASNNPTPAGWGTAELQYSTDDGANWTTILLIDDVNHVVAATCATMMATVPAASLPNGSDVKLQIANTWVAGDYYFYVDNFVAQQDLGCTSGAALSTVVDSCGTNEFSIDVDVTNVADATQINDGTSIYPVSGTGIVTVGPYTPGEIITLTLEHSVAICNVDLGTFESACPTLVDCTAGTPVNTTFCYDSNEDIQYIFQSSDGSALRVDFIEGYFEDCCDDITIYDGLTTADAVLFASDGSEDDDATGIFAISTGDSVLVRMVSDTSVSCAAGSGSGIPLSFNVSCNSCTPATATSTVVNDCSNSGGFNIVVDITDLGSATAITLSDDQASPTQAVNAIGMYTFGPYTNGDVVAITLVDDADASCTENFIGLTQTACPPVNDECADAIALTVNADLACTETTSGTIQGATASGEDEASCGGTEDDDVWFSFVATGDTHTIDLVNVANGTTDLYHSVWEGSCGSLTLVPDSCSDPNSSSVTGLTMGNTYLLRVYSWTATADQTTTFDVCIGTPPPPSTNTSCATADAIECGETLSGNSAASTGNAEDSGCTMGDNGLWYTFTGTGFDVTLVSTASFDHRMAIASGACGTLANIVCDDQSTGEESHTFTTVDGETYYVYIAHYSGGNTSTGSIGLTLTCAGPANDECDGAEAITLGEEVTADNTGATASQVPADCFTGTIRDLWYSFTATATGEAYISTSASQYALYSDCTGTQEGACNTSPISGLIEGNTYYVRINDDGAGRAPGAFDLIVSDVALSTNEFDNPAAFTYYPNPVKNTLTLNAQNTIENVTMYNMLGQEVLRATPNAIDSDLDTSNLQTGTYFVKVTIANITKTIRVIKQ